jgi:hypothetical protein
MSRLNLILIILISVLLLGGGAALWAIVNNHNDETVVLSDVPAKVLDAANNAVPDGQITGVEKEVEGGQIIYEVEKVANGVEYDIDVTADGVVMEVEKEDDDEGEDDD